MVSNNLLKGSIIIGLFNVIGLLLSFVLNIVLASKFGSGAEMDCYLTAVTVPIYLITIISGSLSVTFIPIFNEIKNEKKKWQLFSSLVYISILIVGIITFLVIIFSQNIIGYLSPSFPKEMQDSSVILLRVYSSIILMTVVNELFAGIFYSHGNFMLPTANRLISPITVIIIIFFFKRNLTIVDIVYANVIGSVLQNIVLLRFFAVKKEFTFFLKVNLITKEMRSLGRLIFPLILGSTFYKFLPVFDKYLLSDLSVGSVSNIGYSQKLFLAISQIFSSLISMQIFSHMSLLASKNEISELKNTLRSILNLIVFFIVPLAVILIMFSNPIINIIYQRGKFLPENSIIVAKCFQIYLFSLPAVIIGTIISQGLYVLKDTRSPFIVGLIEVALYVVLSKQLLSHYKVYSLPISYTTYFYFSVIILGFILQRKLPFINFKAFLLKLTKYVVVISIVSTVGYYFSENLNDFSRIVTMFICFILYFIITYLLKDSHSIYIINRLKNETILVFKKD